jgi:hypothetical protein
VVVGLTGGGVVVVVVEVAGAGAGFVQGRTVVVVSTDASAGSRTVGATEGGTAGGVPGPTDTTG